MTKRDDVAAALELMQGGLMFHSYLGDDRGSPRTCWYWDYNEMHRDGFTCQYDAVEDFCQWYAQTRVVKDEPQPAAFDVDKFMMDGIEALTLAAAEEMRARGEYFDSETIAGALAKAWHYAPYTGDPHEDARPVSTDFL